MVSRHAQLGERRAEQEAAHAADGEAGRQRAPHRTHAEDDGDSEDFQEQQDARPRGVKFIMNEGGDDVFAIAHDFRVEDGDDAHQHACGHQAHGQPLAFPVQVLAGFFKDQEPETGYQGGQRAQQHAPEHMLVARQGNLLLELVDGGRFMEQPHRKVPRAAGHQQGRQEVNGEGAQYDFTHEQAAGQGRMEGGGHAGGRGAGYDQAQARRGEVEEAPQGGPHHGGGLHQRAFPADGGAGTYGEDGGQGAQQAGLGGHIAIAQCHGFHVFRGLGRDEAVREEKGEAGQQAARRRNEDAPGPVLPGHFLKDLDLLVAGTARQEVLDQLHPPFKDKGRQCAQRAYDDRPDEDDLLVPQLDFFTQAQRHAEP